MGHQVPPVAPAAAAIEGLIGLLNQGLAVAEMSPFASAAERVVAEKLCAKIGWNPETSTGIATSGGTLANMTAILAARNRAWPEFWRKGCPNGVKPTIITSREAHYSISRSAGVLGLGTDNVCAAELDCHRRMTGESIERALNQAKNAGKTVFCVIASAPSTPIGAIDEVRALSTCGSLVSRGCSAWRAVFVFV